MHRAYICNNSRPKRVALVMTKIKCLKMSRCERKRKRDFVSGFKVWSFHFYSW